MLKEVIKQAIDEGDLGKVEKEKAMKNFNEIAEEMEFEWWINKLFVNHILFVSFLDGATPSIAHI